MPCEDVAGSSGAVLIAWHLLPPVVAHDQGREKGFRKVHMGVQASCNKPRMRKLTWCLGRQGLQSD